MPHDTTPCPIRTNQEELLIDYCAGALDGERQATLIEHTARCAYCAAFVREQMVVWGALDGWRPESISSDFDARLAKRLAAESAAPPVDLVRGVRPGWLRRPRAILGIAAGLAAAVVLYFQVAPSPEANPSTAAMAEAAGELEQAERLLEDLEMLRSLEASAEGPGGSESL